VPNETHNNAGRQSCGAQTQLEIRPADSATTAVQRKTKLALSLSAADLIFHAA
jgi:hypothetical protein